MAAKEGSRSGRSIQLLPSPGALDSALIVGAGVAGLCTARQLLRIGVQVLLLEASPEIGGVWARNYDGYGLQIPWRHYQFPDFTWPKELQPEGEYPTGTQVQAYIKAYAARFGLMRHVRVNCNLLRLRWCAGSRQWEALFCDTLKEKFFKIKVDYTVICSGMYSSPYVPRYRGSELFAGLQLHAKDFTDIGVTRGRRVVIVGAGRTALDCATGLLTSRRAASVTLLYRQSHWPVPRQLLGVPVRRLLFSRAAAAMLPPYYTAGPVDRAVHTIVHPLKRLFWRGVEAAIANKFGFSSGKWAEPRVSLPSDLFYGGQILDDSNAEMMKCENLTAIKGEINQFVRNGVILQDGSFRAADVVLYCTGYEKSYDCFEGDMRGRLGLQKDGLYLYRNCLPCNVPHLAFVGSEVSTYSNILTDSLQALWLAHVLTGAVQLPGPDAMAADVRQQQRWRRDVMPAQRCRGAVLMMYGMQYHDQLLGDMGRQPKRKKFNPLAECFGAYSPEDYTRVVERNHAIAARWQRQRAPPAAPPSLQTESLSREATVAAAERAMEAVEDFYMDRGMASRLGESLAHRAGYGANSDRCGSSAARSRSRGRVELPSTSSVDTTTTNTATHSAATAAANAAAVTSPRLQYGSRCMVAAAVAKARSGPLSGPHHSHLHRSAPSDPDDRSGRTSASASEEDDGVAISQILGFSSSWKAPCQSASQTAAKRVPMHSEGCSHTSLPRSAASPALRTSPLGRPISCRLQLCTYADASMTVGRESSTEQVTSASWLLSSCAADTSGKALPVLDFWNVLAAPVAARGGGALPTPASAAMTAAAAARQASSGLSRQQHPPLPPPPSSVSVVTLRGQPLPGCPSRPQRMLHARYSSGRDREAVRNGAVPACSSGGSGIRGSGLSRAPPSASAELARQPSGPAPTTKPASAPASGPAKLGSSPAPDGAAACLTNVTAEYLPPPPPRPLASMLRKQLQDNLPAPSMPSPPVTPPPPQRPPPPAPQGTSVTRGEANATEAQQMPGSQRAVTPSPTGQRPLTVPEMRLCESWRAVDTITRPATTTATTIIGSGAPDQGDATLAGHGDSSNGSSNGSSSGVEPGGPSDPPSQGPLTPLPSSSAPHGMNTPPASTDSPAQCISRSASSGARADADGSTGGGCAATCADGPMPDGTSMSNSTRASLSSWHQRPRLLTGYVGASTGGSSPPPPPPPLALSSPLSPVELQRKEVESREAAELPDNAVLMLADFDIKHSSRAAASRAV